MKVGELRKALEGVDENLDVVVRAFDDDSDYAGTPFCAEFEVGCDDKPFFAIDCGSDEDAIDEEDDEAASEAQEK